MDAVTILEKYFESKGNLDDILHYKVTKKFFPKSVDANSINVILQYLKHQRCQVLNDVKQDIHAQFTVPIKYIIDEIEEFDNATHECHTINSLIDNLTKVEATMTSQCSSLDQQIDDLTNDIKQLNDNIQQLSHSDSILGSVEEPLQSVEKLENMIREP